MKLILTENQYALLEAIINEAATPFSNKIQEGGFIEIVYQLNKEEKSHLLEITKKYGSGQYFEATNATGRYIVNLGGSLDKENNTFTIIKDGQYKEGSTDAGGRITAPEIVGGGRIIVKNVTGINVSDSSKTVVDKISTDLGDKNNSSNFEDDEKQLGIGTEKRDSEDNEDRKDRRVKQIMKMAYEDPNLRKLIHFQPSILGGLIKLGKAKGIAHVTSLMNKYNIGGKDKEVIKKEFLQNQDYTYEVLKPVTITFGLKQFKLKVGLNYTVTYKDNKFKGGGLKNPYEISQLKKSNDNIYKGTITAIFEQPAGDGTPKSSNKKSEEIILKFSK